MIFIFVIKLNDKIRFKMLGLLGFMDIKENLENFFLERNKNKNV